MKLTRGTHAAITFTIHDAETGELLDDRHAERPMHYTQGAGQMLRGFERRVEGLLEEGDAFDVSLTVAEAYGPRSEQVVQKVQLSTLPPGIQPGMIVELGIPGMEDVLPPVVFHVKDLRGDTAHLDGNHPMAGRALRIQGRVLKLLPGSR